MKRRDTVTKHLAAKWWKMREEGLYGTDIANTCGYDAATVNRHIRAHGESLPIKGDNTIHPFLKTFPSVA